MLVNAALFLGGKSRAAQIRSRAVAEAIEVIKFRARAAEVAAIEEYMRWRWDRFIHRLVEERMGGREAPLGPHADDNSYEEPAPDADGLRASIAMSSVALDLL